MLSTFFHHSLDDVEEMGKHVTEGTRESKKPKVVKLEIEMFFVYQREENIVVVVLASLEKILSIFSKVWFD